MQKLAILICQKYYNTPTAVDNNIFLAELDQAKLNYELVVWDEDNICWEKYTAVLVRATWDYIEGKKDKFIATLESISALNIPIFNALSLLSWNCSKHYLLDLQQKNIRIIKSFITLATQSEALLTFIEEVNSREYVIKPVVSGGGYKTLRVQKEDILKTLNTNFSKDEEVIIQPFMSGIYDGEWSLIFIDNTFSHSVLLKPKLDDFRVQIMHGGTVVAVQPPAIILNEAIKTLSTLPGKAPLYARLDFILQDEEVHLMELELIEPALFFRWAPDSATRLVQAIKRTMKDYQK